MKRINKEDIKLLNKLALPILLSFAVQTIFNITDKMIVGRTSLEGFAVVGIITTILYFIIGSFGVLSSVFNILFAKAYSQKKIKKCNEILNTSLTLAIIIGLALELFFLIFGRFILHNMYHLDGEALKYGIEFLNISGLSIVLNLIIFNISPFFRNMKNTKVYAKATILSLIINFVLDYTLVFGKFGMPKCGIIGAAIGSIIGLLSGLLIYLYEFKKYKDYTINFKVNKNIIKNIIKLYIPLFFQDLIENTIYIIILLSLITKMGISQVAIYNVVDVFGGCLMLIAYAYAGACTTLTLQQYEKDDNQNFINYPTYSTIISLLLYLIFGIIFVCFSNQLTSLITTDKTLIGLVPKYILLGILAQMFNIVLQIYKSLLQGIDEERFTLRISALTFFVTLMVIYIIEKLGNANLNSVYIIILINYLINAIIFYLKYNQKIKFKKKIIKI